MSRGTRWDPRNPAAPVTRTRRPASESTLGEQCAIPRDRLAESGFQIVCGAPAQAVARFRRREILVTNLALRDVADVGLEIGAHQPADSADDVEHGQWRLVAEVVRMALHSQ